jgi:hypothetical protein
MINLETSAQENVAQIEEWTAFDPYHFRQSQPEWWLTDAAGSLVAFCLMDEKGPLAYVRLDAEGEYVRIHTQFAPESIVSKRRLVVGMIECMKQLINFNKPLAKGMVFNSVNPALAAFMEKHLGFKPVGQDDYRLDFEGQT